MPRRQRVQTGNIADVIGELFQDVGAGLPDIALTLHNIKRQSEQDQFQREDRLAARKSEAARIAQGEERIDIAREELNIRQLGLLDERDEGVTGVFRDIFPKQQEPLTPTQLFGRELGLDPELLKRYTAAQVGAAERRAQGPAAKGPSLSAGKEAKQTELDRLGNLIMGRFAESDPEGFNKLIREGKLKPTSDPIVLRAFAEQFPATRREEATGIRSLFQDSTDVSVADPQVQALLDTLRQAFARPALEFGVGTPPPNDGSMTDEEYKAFVAAWGKGQR